MILFRSRAALDPYDYVVLLDNNVGRVIIFILNSASVSQFIPRSCYKVCTAYSDIDRCENLGSRNYDTLRRGLIVLLDSHPYGACD